MIGESNIGGSGLVTKMITYTYISSVFTIKASRGILGIANNATGTQTVTFDSPYTSKDSFTMSGVTNVGSNSTGGMITVDYNATPYETPSSIRFYMSYNQFALLPAQYGSRLVFTGY